MARRIVLHVTHPDGSREGIEWPPTRSIGKIGRIESSHVRLRDPAAARMHAVLELTDEGLFVIDLGSAVGTKVDGRDVNEARLADGDVLELGATRIRIEMTGKPAGHADPRCSPSPRSGPR